MGHAGTIISSSSENAAAKLKVMKSARIEIAETPAVIGKKILEAMQKGYRTFICTNHVGNAHHVAKHRASVSRWSREVIHQDAIARTRLNFCNPITTPSLAVPPSYSPSESGGNVVTGFAIPSAPVPIPDICRVE
ncbi:unnamed protein product [Onchocerca flexuosa]|uniref:PK domain-containing protein n=1 Tax=Onchocerca flexuosa TaxID=387005 RepID=A0A183I2Y6_9BILA|nr:unnamed protein product [Onchocerca flexuosa]